MREYNAQKTLNEDNNLKDYKILQLETYDEIRKVVYDFDGVFRPSISERVSDLDVYADKLYKNALVFIAKNVDILGFVAFYANDNDTRAAYLTQIAVQPAAQGRKMGQELLHFCAETAKTKGMTQLKLEVNNCNYTAIRLYEKNGFESRGQASLDSIYMIKRL